MGIEKSEWHLDKKVTLALIFALLANAFASVWWASRLDSTVGQHEQKIAAITVTVSQLANQQTSVSESLARIQEAQKYQSEMLREVRDQLKDK